MGSRERVAREKAELKKKREEEILSAAEELFLDKGFTATTIGDIAGSCELTNGAIYLYFKNKNELILNIMIKIIRRFGDLLGEAADETSVETGLMRVRRLMSIYNKTFEKYRIYHILDAQFNALFCESYPDSPLIEEYFGVNTRVLRILSTAVGTGIDDGSISSPLSAERTAGMLLNAVNSYVEKISLRKGLMEEEQGIKMEDELEDYINFLIGGLS